MAVVKRVDVLANVARPAGHASWASGFILKGILPNSVTELKISSFNQRHSFSLIGEPSKSQKIVLTSW
jgi:hypothetical protein